MTYTNWNLESPCMTYGWDFDVNTWIEGGIKRFMPVLRWRLLRQAYTIEFK